VSLRCDPWEQLSRDQWVQQQVEDMLGEAVTMADDEATVAYSLSQQQRQELPIAFCQHFSTTLQQRTSPPPAAVRSWLRQQLGISLCTYGSDIGMDSGVDTGADSGADSGADASDEDMADVPDGAAGNQQQQQRARTGTQQGSQQRGRRKHQQQQQQQQEQPSQPLRRTGRSNAGRMSAEFASTYGPVGGIQRKGRVGSGNTQQASSAGILPSTPAAITNPRRARRRAEGPT
jgi:hypothetical protein